MTKSIALVEPISEVIVGVDTHKLVHVAVAINLLGARLATVSVPADRAGYAELVAWARALGAVEAFGIEGTGSYGLGLASFVRRQAIRVVEVNHCDRRLRRNNGKSDTIDAETAARSVLSGIATAVPKSAGGALEMVRQIKIARDTAVKARSAAIITLKALIVNAPGELREALESSSFGCAGTSRPSIASPAAPPKVYQRRTSFAASDASSHARSTAPSLPITKPTRTSPKPPERFFPRLLTYRGVKGASDSLSFG